MAAYTTTTRIKDLINQSGTSVYNAFDDDAITNAVAYANDYLEEIGVPTSSITEGMKAAGDQFALAYLADGLILQMAIRGANHPSIENLRSYAKEMRATAEKTALAYTSLAFKNPKLVQNKNWGIWPKNVRASS